MKILHIDTEKTWRGGQQQVFSLVQGLARKGHSNIAVVQKNSPLAQKLKTICPLFEIQHRWEWDFISAHYVNRFIKRENVDMIHAHSAHGTALAAFSQLNTSVPYVVTRRVDFSVGKNPFSRWKYKKAAAVIAISDKIRNVLIQSGVPSQKIFRVPSGIDPTKYHHVKPVLKEAIGYTQSDFLIGQVAALAPHKDQTTFIKSLAELIKRGRGVKGVIVGEGPRRKELERTIQELRLGIHVQLLGFKENPLDFLAAFDVFCLSSKEEGLGTSLLDAMNLKIPVVATQAGGIPELIENGITGYTCEPQNFHSLADTLELCMDDSKKIQIIAKAAQKAKEFDISKTVDATENVYKWVLASYPQSCPQN